MRYIIGLLLGIGLIVLTFILIIRAFSGGDNTPKTPKTALTDYATTETITRYTIDGPEISEAQHVRVRITVGKDQVLYEQVQGYEGKLIQSKTYPSNVQAYSTFLRALDLAGYTQANKTASDDERGYCPTGQRYIYEIIDGGDTKQRLWSTSCSAKQGTFLGQTSTVRFLFQKQVPDYTNLTSKIRLSGS
jgi:hypothetical protein